MSELVSKRDFMKWLAEGYGEWSTETNGVEIQFSYHRGEEEDPVNSNIMVRRWNETEWSTPTKEYIFTGGFCPCVTTDREVD